MKQKVKIGILLSGRGSNFRSIVNALESGELADTEIVLVVSNKIDAPGLHYAREKGFENAVIANNDNMLLLALQKANVDIVVLAGYTRILGTELVQAYRDKILNIHPSLLPAYGGKGMVGLKVHEAVIAAGEKQSGCTVHLVTEDIDAGPVLGQTVVNIVSGETSETLAEKILAEEHRLYPVVLHRFIQERFLQEVIPSHA